MSSKHYDVLSAIRTTILGLDLTGIADANVKIALLPTADKLIKAEALTMPGIIISPWLSETINRSPLTGTNVADVYGYPSVVAIVDQAASPALTTNLDKYLTWRESIVQAFHMQRGTGVAGEIETTAELGPIVEFQPWIEADLFVSCITVRTYVKVTVR